MKSSFTVALFIGAISATQLNSMRRHHHGKSKKWDADTEANTDVASYQADVPAGYGGTAVKNASNATNASDAVGSKLIQRPSQKTHVALKKKHHRHHVNNQQLLFSLMQGSTLGAYDEQDTADYWKDKMDTHSNDSEYSDATPEGYGYTADLQTQANNMMRAPAGWGDLQAAQDAHNDYIKESLINHTNEDHYVPDAPIGMGEITYDVQLGNQAPEGWGDLAAAKEAHRDYIHDSTNEHADEDDYIPDAPVGIDQEYELQLKAEGTTAKLNREQNNIMLAEATAPENWGDLSFYKDAHRQDIVDAVEEHADEDDYKLDAPVGIDQEYAVQLSAQTAPENWGDLTFYKDAHRQEIVDSQTDHADEENYMGDYPAEMADVVTYDLQLKQTQMHINELNNNILLQLNPNGLTVEEQAEEHRDYIHDSINEHADEEDYKLDTPSEIEVEYAVQLKNQDNQMVQLQSQKHAGLSSPGWGDVDLMMDNIRTGIKDDLEEHADETEYKITVPQDMIDDGIIEYDDK